MQIRPSKIIVTSNFKIENIFNGSIHAVIWRRFYKIHISEEGSLTVIKRETCKHNCQFLFMLHSLNYVIHI